MLTGSLNEMSLSDILRILSASSQTGCLVLFDTTVRATFYLKIGQLSHCEYNLNAATGQSTIQGIDAVSKACSLIHCHFRFDMHLMSDHETLLKYPTPKLIAGITQFIEKRKAPEIKLPEPDSVLLYQSIEDLKSFKASQEELGLLLLANGNRSLTDIAAIANLGIRQVQEWASKFLSHGLLGTSDSSKANVQTNTATAPIQATNSTSIETPKTVRLWRGKPI